MVLLIYGQVSIQNESKVNPIKNKINNNYKGVDVKMKMMSSEQYQGSILGGLVLEIEQLKQENLELRMENELLHNRNKAKYEAEYEINEEGGYTDEEFKNLAIAYAIYGY